MPTRGRWDPEQPGFYLDRTDQHHDEVALYYDGTDPKTGCGAPCFDLRGTSC